MEAMSLGLLNHTSTTALEQRNAAPTTNATGNSGGTGAAASGANASSITANDFLTLLVTEMKNQDPTANTDPNQYINQLVQVNSLEQLISINQTVTQDSQALTGDPAAGSKDATIHNGALAGSHAQHSSGGPASMGASAAQAPATGIDSSRASKIAAGNFTIPAPNPAAQRVAQSLGGFHPAV